MPNKKQFIIPEPEKDSTSEYLNTYSEVLPTSVLKEYLKNPKTLEKDKEYPKQYNMLKDILKYVKDNEFLSKKVSKASNLKEVIDILDNTQFEYINPKGKEEAFKITIEKDPSLKTSILEAASYAGVDKDIFTHRLIKEGIGTEWIKDYNNGSKGLTYLEKKLSGKLPTTKYAERDTINSFGRFGLDILGKIIQLGENNWKTEKPIYEAWINQPEQIDYTPKDTINELGEKITSMTFTSDNKRTAIDKVLRSMAIYFKGMKDYYNTLPNFRKASKEAQKTILNKAYNYGIPRTSIKDSTSRNFKVETYNFMKQDGGRITLPKRKYDIDGVLPSGEPLIGAVSASKPLTLNKVALQNTTPTKTGLGLNIGNGTLASILDTGSALIGKDYSGKRGNITAGIDAGYKATSDIMMAINPVIGLGMKGTQLLGNVADKITGGTDKMTTADAILGSSLFNLSGIGLVNSIFGKKSRKFNVDQQVANNSSYTGTGKFISDAGGLSGKKYGAFSRKARKKANKKMDEAQAYQDTIGGILDDASDKFSRQASSSDMFANRSQLEQSGGLGNVMFGREGLKFIQRFRRKYASGGRVYKDNDPTSSTFKDFQTGDVQKRLSKSNTVINTKDSNILTYTDPKTGKQYTNDDIVEQMSKYNIPVLKAFQELNPNINVPEFLNRIESEQLYSKDNLNNIITPMAEQFKSIGSDEESKNILNKYLKEAGFTPEEYWSHKALADKVNYTNDPTLGANEESKNKGILIGPRYIARLPGRNRLLDAKTKATISYTNPYEGYLNLVQPQIAMHKDGGKISDKNIIPEGKLHKELHHLDNEDISRKGVPVILKEGDKVTQIAEIERHELILRKEVTDKLEELYKEGTDEAAIEAGKLLVKEILHNTIDKTKLIKEVE